MEALELADTERAAFKEYEEAMSRLAEDDAMRLQAPPRNPILASFDLEPEAYVLRVVEKVPSTALQDALLVLPFSNVVSLMGYLNIWAQNVSILVFWGPTLLLLHLSGLEYRSCVPLNFLSTQNSSSSNRSQSNYANFPDSFTQTSTRGSSAAKEQDWVQSGCFAVHP